MPVGEVFDVIVLGSGVAGLSAALAAHQKGLKPLLIEKADKLGGTTANSYGLVWVGGNHLMKAAGDNDDREDIVDYLHFLGGGEISEERSDTFIDHAPEVIRFFESCGIRFQLVPSIVDHYYGVARGAKNTGRTIEVELISGFDLGDWRDKVRTPKDAPYYVTAGEQLKWGGINRHSTWDQEIVRNRVKRDIRGKGVGLVTHFVKALVQRQVPILLNERVRRLLIKDGTVAGVELSDGKHVQATKGVVIATGGYEWNEDLMRDFDHIPGLSPQSPSSSTGDGLILGAEIGAAIRRIRNNLNIMLGFQLVPDGLNSEPIQTMAGINELCSPHTMVVNARGKRFGDESYFQRLVPELMHFDTMRHTYANLPCYLIFDAQYPSSYALAHLPIGSKVPQSVTRAGCIRELANKLNIDADNLEATTQRFNEFAKAGIDEDFQRGSMQWRLATAPGARNNNSLGPIDTAPFYGIELHPSLGTSSAGLLTDVNGQVVHQRRHPIPGLYASGIVSARTEIGTGYQAGLILASAMTFSYLAILSMLAQQARQTIAVTRT